MSSARKRVHDLLSFDLALHASLRDGNLSLSNSDGVSSELRSLLAPSHDGRRGRALPRRRGDSLIVVGFDEAGRGALAGPVTVACVHFDLGEASLDGSEGLIAALSGLDDSKRLTARRREQLYEPITGLARWGVGCASAGEIDRWGIVPACRTAARRAYRRMGALAAVALFDRGLSMRVGTDDERSDAFPGEIALTRGDARSLHVAAASIVAKVTRDALMRRLASAFPGYALERHKGYGTAAHREAIQRLGSTRIHRRTFLREG